MITKNQIKELRSRFQEDKHRTPRHGTFTFDIESYLNHYGITFRTKQSSAGTLYVLNNCLFDESHKKGEASIINLSDGKLVYQCFHNSCQGRTWQEARERISGTDKLTPFLPSLDTHSQEQSDASKTPLVNAIGTDAPKNVLDFTSLLDLFAEPEERVSWIVDGLLPAGGFSGIFGKPKGGKTTLVRNLALCVAQGKEFLGRITIQGTVLYLALEEKRYEVRKHFQDMGASGNEGIYIFASSAPVDALTQLKEAAYDRRPGLIIIDPLFRLARVRDGNDYVQVTAALEPLLMLARETGAHVMIVHHTGKGERSGGDSILGSTAILGSVDTAILLKRNDKYRTIQTIQRYGQDLEETTLSFDTDTRVVRLGETKDEKDLKTMEDTIYNYLAQQTDPVAEAEILDAVEGRRALKVKAVRTLLDKGIATRQGRGGRAEPFRYSCSLVPTVYSGTREHESKYRCTLLAASKESCSQHPRHNETVQKNEHQETTHAALVSEDDDHTLPGLHIEEV